MRRIPRLSVLLAALALLVTGGSDALAQYYDDSGRYPTIERFRPAPSYQQRPMRQRQQQYYQGQQVYQGRQYYSGQQYYFPGQQPYYPGMQVYPDARQQQGYRERYVYPGERTRRPRRAEPRRRAVPSAPRVAETKPKIEPTTFIAIFGDRLGEQVAAGLEDAYDDKPEVEIVDETQGEGGLVRTDVHDWPKLIQEHLEKNPKTTAIMVMLGANDRQAIREGETAHDPLSERWRELYRQRVDAVVRAVSEKAVPFVWVGAPPVKNEKASADLLAINEILRERVQRAGGVFVDIWPGFVNEENRYAVTGPDVAGQTAKLRLNDGVHFTTAGARKAAHFVETELKRILDAKAAGSAVAALPATPEASAAGEQNGAGGTEAAAPAPAPAVKAPRPVVGPVLPLTKPETSPGGTLLTGRPKLEGDGPAIADRALREGVPPAPKPGRADDFTWPPPS